MQTLANRVLRTLNQGAEPSEKRTDRVIPKNRKPAKPELWTIVHFGVSGSGIAFSKKDPMLMPTLWLFSMLLLVNFLRNGDQHKSDSWMRMCADCKSHSHSGSGSGSDCSPAECRQQLYRLQPNWAECWHTVRTGLWRRPAANICTGNVFNTHRHHQVSILINYNYSCQGLSPVHPLAPHHFRSGAWF